MGRIYSGNLQLMDTSVAHIDDIRCFTKDYISGVKSMPWMAAHYIYGAEFCIFLDTSATIKSIDKIEIFSPDGGKWEKFTIHSVVRSYGSVLITGIPATLANYVYGNTYLARVYGIHFA